MITSSGVYITKRYLSKERWISYWAQVNEVFKIDPKDILEIGPGNDIVSSVLKKIGYSVKTLDIDSSNNPDFVMDVTKVEDSLIGKYDLILACQVLEHIPYDNFIKALGELQKVSRRYLIVSLPYTNRGSLKFYLSFMFLPFLRKISCIKVVTLFSYKWKFNGEHYWEIGVKGCSLKRILDDISNTGWKILRHYPVKENPYHYFIVCEKKS